MLNENAHFEPESEKNDMRAREINYKDRNKYSQNGAEGGKFGKVGNELSNETKKENGNTFRYSKSKKESHQNEIARTNISRLYVCTNDVLFLCSLQICEPDFRNWIR